tara:strand:- start:74 stop:469 length:396 start_codon:yes stop_codon:yes gene_type:complete
MKKNTADSISFVRMIGANLKFLRLHRQTFMPQKVVAAALGITHQQVNKYETGLNTPCAYRLKQLADFFGVTCNDLVDPSYIVKNTKNHEVLDRGFDAAKYEQFDDEYPPGSGGLEHDPKMRATYDAILGDD